MTSPIRTFLQTLVKNVIYLFGGLVMCFYTSWRLSILAFTTMAPIIYITREYAIWSKRLWTKVWASWAKSNEVATESIANVRTVRAFTAEDYQIGRFQQASKDAVDTLIKNVYGNTLSSTLSNYLDLAAGVMILWYHNFDEYKNIGVHAGKVLLHIKFFLEYHFVILSHGHDIFSNVELC